MHYVIGDVHCCFKELKLLLNKIESQDSDAIIYFVGDWVDRGPNVSEVMKWVVDNITTDGKYRSVRGNHDHEALDWYEKKFLPWSKEDHDSTDCLPETYYDFADVVDRDFNRDPKAIEPFMEMVKAMPYNVTVEVITTGNVNVTYRICHAWHSLVNEAYRQDFPDDYAYSNLYERNYWGYYRDNEIIVHGHTPTILHDYLLRGHHSDRPGLIGYRARRQLWSDMNT